MNKGLTILHLNIHYLYPKVDKIKSTIADKHIDMMCFCETFLTDTFCDYEISLGNYSRFRRDSGSGAMSDKKVIISGVSHGYVLGPILFRYI